MEIYREVLQRGLPADLFCFNKLMNKLCKEGEMKDAHAVFDEFARRVFKPSVLSFNTLIHGYRRLSDVIEGFRLKSLMEESGALPDVYTYSVLINGLCVSETDMDSACELFDEITSKGLVPNDVTFTCLITGYCKSGIIDLGIKIYQNVEPRYET